MRQTSLSVALEVKPESQDRLSGLLDAMRDRRSTDPSGGKGPYAEFLTTVPSLHFLSMSVFPGFDYDPLFVLEANFDGPPGPFWSQLEAAIAPDLRAILRCCKRPLDACGPLYDAVTDSGSRAPIAPYLEARSQRPTVFHHGNRGIGRDRILGERALFLATRETLAEQGYHGLDASAVHVRLRAALLPEFGWLDEKPPARIGFWEGLGDYARLALFALALLFALSLPGILAVGMLGRVFPAVAKGPDILIGAAAGILLSLLALAIWIRRLERRDSSQDAPPVDQAMLREMARREDWIPQNHMGSVVLVKPGVLRLPLLRVAHHGLQLLLRAMPRMRQGYLGSMRTIHFAHWALVNNRSRLLFLSNFDQTWESYLDDFIEKAHEGLTLAWCCGVGFPPARFLIFDGASRGRQFKQWARHSMTVSRFWYSAYKDLTADQIERNWRVANGLRKRRLSQAEAGKWARDL